MGVTLSSHPGNAPDRPLQLRARRTELEFDRETLVTKSRGMSPLTSTMWPKARNCGREPAAEFSGHLDVAGEVILGSTRANVPECPAEPVGRTAVWAPQSLPTRRDRSRLLES